MAGDSSTPSPDETPTVGTPRPETDPDATRIAAHGGGETWVAAPASDAGFGRYRIVDELGRGGQAVVYLAEDTQLGRRVALKVVSSQALNAASRVRFEREARVTSKLEHPGICPVYDVGAHGGVSYIAMRFIDGAPLSALIARSRIADDTPTSFFDSPADGPSDAGEVTTEGRALDREDVMKIVGLGARLARALHTAHEAGVVHRDLKPGNIMITGEHQPVILDFGLASDAEETSETLTQSGDVFGTPAYMSPEQVRGERLDRRTDVWSLGVTLWEMLAGVRPFQGPTREALYRAIKQNDAPRLRDANPTVDRDLETVVETALEKDLGRRYATAADLADDLERALRGEPVAARRIGPVGRALRWAKRRKAAAAVIALIAIGLPLVGVLGTRVALTWNAVQEQKRNERAREVERLVNAGFIDSVPEYGRERLERGYQAFDRALELDPANETAAGGLLFALLYLGRLDDLLAELDGRLARFRDNPVFALIANSARGVASDLSRFDDGESEVELFLLGRFYNTEAERRGDAAYAERAFRLLRRAVDTASRPQLMYYSELALAAFDTGRLDELTHVGRVMTRLWPDQPEGWFNAGIAVRETDPEESLALLQRAVELAPEMSGAYQNISVLHRRAGRTEEALRTAELAVQMAADSAQNQLAWANALAEVGRLDEAEAAARESLAIMPANGPALTALSIILASRGRPQDADDDVARAVAAHPDDLAVAEAAGVHFLRRGDPKRAIEFLERIHARSPVDANAAMNCGVARMATGDIRGAAEAFARAGRLRPDDLVAHGNHAAALSHLFRHDEALAIAREHLGDHPDDAGLNRTLAQLLAATGRYAESIPYFERGRGDGIAPAIFDGLIAESRAMAAQERFADAIEAGTQVELPASLDELADVAEILARRGRIDDAAALYEGIWEDILEIEGFSRDRLLAAGVYALMGTGRSRSAEFDPGILREWRERARDLLEADIEYLEEFGLPSRDFESIRFVLLYWRSDRFERLRDMGALAGSTPEERAAWRGLYDRLDALGAAVNPHESKD